MYLQSASLGVVSPGNPRIMDNMQEKAKNETDKTDKNDYYDYSNNKVSDACAHTCNLR